VKLVATIRTTETQEIEAEGDDYSALKAQLEAMVPEGFQMLSVRKAD